MTLCLLHHSCEGESPLKFRSMSVRRNHAFSIRTRPWVAVDLRNLTTPHPDARLASAKHRKLIKQTCTHTCASRYISRHTCTAASKRADSLSPVWTTLSLCMYILQSLCTIRHLNILTVMRRTRIQSLRAPRPVLGAINTRVMDIRAILKPENVMR